MYLKLEDHNSNQDIIVMDAHELYGEKGNFRIMHFSNEAIQGAQDLNDPSRIVFEYPRAIIHLMEWNDPSLEDIFIIGHGIGTIPSYFSDKRCTVAEISSTIAEISRQYFGYDQNNVLIGDGRKILEAEQDDNLDYIIVDAFNENGTPHHLVTREFFQMAYERLDSEGFIILNLFGRSNHDSLLNAIHTTINDVFPYVSSFALAADASIDTRNILMIGGKKQVKYQANHLFGFTEMECGEGFIMWDDPSV
ncbi:spermidine synthase [Paenibacillus dakarensis]|uniref:spermidine synthase n=1 Tax=Paenibacillus dakarensis TaxID=1527293 RepID=UPI000A7AD661|nr:fused MFS/spermidine synthase [Paenibacillus dakarensis]